MGAPPRLRALSPRLIGSRGLSFWGFRFLALGPYCAPAPRLVWPRTVDREAPFGQAPLTIRGAEEEACPGLDSRTSRCQETARLSKFPANPASRPGACQPESVPGGASAALLIRKCWPPRGRAGKVRGWPGSRRFGDRVGTRQAARRRHPVAARALVPPRPGKGWSRPVPDPARQARVCTWMSLGPAGMARSAAAAGVASPRARPLPAGKRRGAGKAGGAPRASRAAYAPSCPRVPHGRGRRARAGPATAAAASGAAPRGQDAAGGAEARKARPWAGAARCGGHAGPPAPSGAARAVMSRGGGAGTPARGCMQPQTYSKFPRSCERPKVVTCTSPLGGRGCLSLCSKEAFRRLPLSV